MSSMYSSYFTKQLCRPETVTVSFHPHPLRLKNGHETPYQCAGCKEKGLGKCYECEEDAENCGSCHLHPQCYDLFKSCHSSIKFTFLESKKCDFVFQKELAPGGGGGRRGCDACWKEVKGWFYTCKMCKKPHYLHPCCANLPIKQKGDEKEKGKENGVVLYLKAKTSSTCQYCKRENIADKLRGWFYVSNCGKHCYHVGCVMDMALENLSRDIGDDDVGYVMQEIRSSTSTDNDDRQEIRSSSSSTDDDDRRKPFSCEPLTRAESVGAITKPRTRKVGTEKFLTGAAKIALNLIISAIFGIPLADACGAFYHLF